MVMLRNNERVQKSKSLSAVMGAVRKELPFTLAFSASYLALAFLSFEINPESLISPSYLPVGLIVAGTMVYGWRIIFSVFIATFLFVPLLGYDLITALMLSSPLAIVLERSNCVFCVTTDKVQSLIPSLTGRQAPVH